MQLELYLLIFGALFFVYAYTKSNSSPEYRFVNRRRRLLIDYAESIGCADSFQCCLIGPAEWSPFAYKKVKTVVGHFNGKNKKYTFFVVDLRGREIIESHFFYPQGSPFNHLIQVSLSTLVTGNSLIQELIDLDSNESRVTSGDGELLGMWSHELPKLVTISKKKGHWQ